MKKHTLICPTCRRAVKTLPTAAMAKVPSHQDTALGQVCLGSGMTVQTVFAEHPSVPVALG